MRRKTSGAYNKGYVYERECDSFHLRVYSILHLGSYLRFQFNKNKLILALLLTI
jgi:hypothetical protein